MKTLYCVDEVPILAHQVGDNYCHELDGYESHTLGEFDNVTDAYRFLREVSDTRYFELHESGHGLQSVSYKDYEISRYVLDGCGNVEDGPDYIDGDTSLPDMVRWAMDSHQSEYHKWLDYRVDYFRSVTDFLPVQRDMPESVAILQEHTDYTIEFDGEHVGYTVTDGNLTLWICDEGTLMCDALESLYLCENNLD